MSAMNSLINVVEEIEQGQLPDDQPIANSHLIMENKSIKDNTLLASSMAVGSAGGQVSSQSSQIIFETVFDAHPPDYQYVAQKKKKKIHKIQHKTKTIISKDSIKDKQSFQRDRRGQKKNSPPQEPNPVNNVGNIQGNNQYQRGQFYQGNGYGYQQVQMMNGMQYMPPPGYPGYSVSNKFIPPQQPYAFNPQMRMMPPVPPMQPMQSITPMPPMPPMQPMHSIPMMSPMQIPGPYQVPQNMMRPQFTQNYKPLPVNHFPIQGQQLAMNHPPYPYHASKPSQYTKQQLIRQNTIQTNYNQQAYQKNYSHYVNQTTNLTGYTNITNNHNGGQSNQYNGQNNQVFNVSSSQKVYQKSNQKSILHKQQIQLLKIDKKKQALQSLKKDAKKGLKMFTNDEQLDILQMLKCLIKYGQNRKTLFAPSSTSFDDIKQKIASDSYEQSLSGIQQLMVSSDEVKKQGLTKVMQSLQMRDVLLKIKERKIARKVILDTQSSIPIKKVQQTISRDPRVQLRASKTK